MQLRIHGDRPEDDDTEELEILSMTSPLVGESYLLSMARKKKEQLLITADTNIIPGFFRSLDDAKAQMEDEAILHMSSDELGFFLFTYQENLHSILLSIYDSFVREKRLYDRAKEVIVAALRKVSVIEEKTDAQDRLQRLSITQFQQQLDEDLVQININHPDNDLKYRARTAVQKAPSRVKSDLEVISGEDTEDWL